MLKDFVKQRYAIVGRRHRRARSRPGKASFEDARSSTCSKKGDADKNVSGRQEMLENILNRYLK